MKEVAEADGRGEIRRGGDGDGDTSVEMSSALPSSDIDSRTRVGREEDWEPLSRSGHEFGSFAAALNTH